MNLFTAKALRFQKGNKPVEPIDKFELDLEEELLLQQQQQEQQLRAEEEMFDY